MLAFAICPTLKRGGGGGGEGESMNEANCFNLPKRFVEDCSCSTAPHQFSKKTVSAIVVRRCRTAYLPICGKHKTLASFKSGCRAIIAIIFVAITFN